MAGALRDTDGWLNSDTDSLESSPLLEAETPRSCYAAHRDSQSDAAHRGDRPLDRPLDRPIDISPEKNPTGASSESVAGMPKHLSKISPEFGARLEHLKPQQKIRAVVMLEIDRPEAARMSGSPAPSAPPRRQNLDERKAAIARIRTAAQQSLEEIRPILEAFHAHLLAPSPDAVGAVPVEIDAAGIPALAQSSRVRTILEDQAVRTIDGSRVQRPYSSPFSR